jgi:hypothetical protein
MSITLGPREMPLQFSDLAYVQYFVDIKRECVPPAPAPPLQLHH